MIKMIFLFVLGPAHIIKKRLYNLCKMLIFQKMEEIKLQKLKTWNVEPGDICAVEVEESYTMLSVETKVLSNAESLKPKILKKVMADYVVNEYKKAVKTCCECPTKAKVKTTLITLFLGVLPSFRDLFIDFNLGVSCIMEGDYGWGGKIFFFILLLNWSARNA